MAPEGKGARDLPWLAAFGIDVVSAFGAAFCIAPIVSMIDQAIIENASGRQTLLASLRTNALQLVSKPQAFFTKPAFLLLWGVYGGTYSAANLINTTCDKAESSSATRAAAKFVGVSATNLGLNISKDAVFTKMFAAPGAVPKPIPMPTFFCFGMRDSLTVLASFNIAPLAAEALAESGVMSKGTATTTMQLACPIAMQWLSVPLHLLGLDMYNRPGVPSAARTAEIQAKYLPTALARSARIGPAFGVGKLLNDPVRASFQLKAEASLGVADKVKIQ